MRKDFCYTEVELAIEEVDPADLARLCKTAHDMGFETNPILIHNYIEGCSAMSDNFLTVDPKGNIYKCIAAPYYEEHRFGTLDEEGNLVDINHKAYCAWTLRDPLLIEECAACTFSPFCGGGCALTAYTKHGTMFVPDCEGKDLREIVRTFIMLKYPELFEEDSYETIVLGDENIL